jgi:hypothetical protein
MFLRRYGNRNVSSINGTETILEERIESRIVMDFWLHLMRIRRLKETASKCGNDHLKEVVDVMVEGVVAMPKEYLKILI